jgi:hypothetical protein
MFFFLLWLPFISICYLSQRPWSWHILPGLPSSPYRSQWKPQWPHTSCLLHAWQTSITWMMLRSASGTNRGMGTSRACWNFSLVGFWVPEQLGEMKTIPWRTGVGRALHGSLFKHTPFEFTLLHPHIYSGYGLADFWDARKAFSHCPGAKYLTSFQWCYSLLQPHPSWCNFALTSFMAKPHILNLSTLFFIPSFH